jgi:hypothetical protein
MKQPSVFDSSSPTALVFSDALALVCLGNSQVRLHARHLLWFCAVRPHSSTQPPLQASSIMNYTLDESAPRQRSTPQETIQSP